MVYFVVLFAFLVALPFALEAMRQPIDKEARGFEPGEVASLSKGATFCEWHGPRSDRVIVLIHGLTTPSWVFGGLTRGLAMMGYHILTYDLYGRGWSDRPRSAQNMRFHLTQLTELLADQEVEGPVTLMGYSMGGMIATHFAARHPEYVEQLILLAPAGIDITPPRALALCGKWGPFGSWLWALIGGLGLTLSARGERKPASVITDYAARMRAETRKRGFLRAVLSSFRATLGEEQEQDHREIANLPIRVLAIWGEDDKVIPKTAMGKLTQWNRHARHHMISGVGHGLPHTAPNDVIGAINTFEQEI